MSPICAERSTAFFLKQLGRAPLHTALPHPLPFSNNKVLPLEKAQAFMHVT
jgi:hypothetical protein